MSRSDTLSVIKLHPIMPKLYPNIPLLKIRLPLWAWVVRKCKSALPSYRSPGSLPSADSATRGVGGGGHRAPPVFSL